MLPHSERIHATLNPHRLHTATVWHILINPTQAVTAATKIPVDWTHAAPGRYCNRLWRWALYNMMCSCTWPLSCAESQSALWCSELALLLSAELARCAVESASPLSSRLDHQSAVARDSVTSLWRHRHCLSLAVNLWVVHPSRRSHGVLCSPATVHSRVVAVICLISHLHTRNTTIRELVTRQLDCEMACWQHKLASAARLGPYMTLSMTCDQNSSRILRKNYNVNLRHNCLHTLVLPQHCSQLSKFRLSNPQVFLRKTVYDRPRLTSGHYAKLMV